MTQSGTTFPRDFLWGASTSAYQIEGATNEGGRGRSIWDDFSSTPGKTYQGETGDVAIDHYHRVAEDVDLMARLGLNAYCFSLAWPRILPNGTGAINQSGLDFYERLVDTLLAKGIAPVVKLYHWDLPSALHANGGWLNRDTAEIFADYAEIVTRRLGDRVNYWITQNEPWCVSYLGYALGIHAPGMRDMQLGIIAGHHVLLSHGLAVPRIRAHAGPHAQVGISLDCWPIHTIHDHQESREAAEQADAFRNRWFFDPVFKKSYPERLFADYGVKPPPIEAGDFDIIATPIDFLGFNYYSRMVVQHKATNGSANNGTPECYEAVNVIPGSSYTATNWEIYPQGLLEALQRVQRDYAPPAIFITENGAAFHDHLNGDQPIRDPLRKQYLLQHVQKVEQAIAQGVPIRGYFIWSLLDNYEWAEGYSKRFGLVYVDFPTQQRIIKESGQWYASFIQAQRAVYNS